MQQEEGYIKYAIRWTEAPSLKLSAFSDLILYRNSLRRLDFIGVYEDGTGYGNISKRINNKGQFMISGTRTGGIIRAGENDFSFVTDFDIDKNTLGCTGMVKASAEALTHAAFYLAEKNIAAVLHAHDLKLWKALLHSVSATAEHVAYGTPAMAHEIFRLLKTQKLKEEKILVTAGHTEGIFTFGKNLQEAYSVLMHFANANYY